MLALLLLNLLALDGEIGYRVTLIPEGSPAARAGLRPGDILAEPGPLPARLRAAGDDGVVSIPVFRLDADLHYQRQTLKITFQPGETRRLGTTGDFGFLLSAPDPALTLRRDDFIPKIDETFVHSPADLALLDAARQKKASIAIHVTRPQRDGFVNLVLRPAL